MATKLPAIPRLSTSDKALAGWAAAVTEHLEVRAGTRGNPDDAAVTKAELASAVKVTKSQTGDQPTLLGNGASFDNDTRSYHELSFASDEFRRAVQAEVRTMLDKQPSSQDASIMARIRQVEAKAGAGGSLPSRALRVSQHAATAGSPELVPDVVFFNGVRISDFASDYFKRLYSAETVVKVALSSDSMFYNGFTVEQWAQWVFEQLADRNNRILALEQRSTNLESYANYLEQTLANAWNAINDLSTRVSALEAAP